MSRRAMTAITGDSPRLCYSATMKRQVLALAMLLLALGPLAAPAWADTLVRVTVRGPDGSPAAGVAVAGPQAGRPGPPGGRVGRARAGQRRYRQFSSWRRAAVRRLQHQRR